MRNLVTYKAGALLSGMDYVPKCEFVDVYFNGEYNGIYILIERPGIESTKIDIDEADESDITGGYFIEKDIAMKVDFARDMWFDCPYWANQTQDYFVLKQPEPASSELTARMLEYLEEHMKSVHNAVMGISGEDYQKYIDVDSWIDYIIIQEIKNIDGNFKQAVTCINRVVDDRLYIIAIWDFDIASGRRHLIMPVWNTMMPGLRRRKRTARVHCDKQFRSVVQRTVTHLDFQARFKQRC